MWVRVTEEAQKEGTHWMWYFHRVGEVFEVVSEYGDSYKVLDPKTEQFRKLPIKFALAAGEDSAILQLRQLQRLYTLALDLHDDKWAQEVQEQIEQEEHRANCTCAVHPESAPCSWCTDGITLEERFDEAVKAPRKSGKGTKQ
jgi:hypothetical protein